MVIRIQKFVFITAFFFFFQLYADFLLTGDSAAASGKTFSYNVFAHVLGAEDTLYIGRNDASTGTTNTVSTYAVSAVKAGTTGFLPLAPEKVFLNGVANTVNPLIGEKISLLGMYGGGPLVVRSDAPQHLYWIASGSRTFDMDVVKIENVKDAQGATNADGSTTAGIVALANAGSSCVFAAVKASGGDFGDVGSGIALLGRGGGSLIQVAAVTGDTGVKALGVDLTTSALKITTDLAAIDASIIDMYWDDILNRLYICVQATGAAGVSDGARAVMMAYLENVTRIGSDGKPVIEAKLKFAPIAPAAAFSGTSYIVGGVGSSVVADIRKVRVMHTSTGASYLITLGNAAGAAVQTTVRAIPLVNKRLNYSVGATSWIADTTHGAIASKTVNAGTNLKEYFTTSGNIAVFAGRGFQVAASTTGDMTTQLEVPAKVGGGVAPGNVLAMQVYKDTVFISVDGNDDEVRVFSSQALLDGDGAIKAWTPWRAVSRPVTGTHKVYGIGYQGSVGRLYTLQGSSTSTVDTIKTTVWGNGSTDGLLGGTTSDAAVGFESLLSNSFSQTEGGIQGLFDFPRQTAGFSQTTGRRLSMMIATGYKKIVLVETGQDNGSSVFVPHVGNFSHADNITVTGGTLNIARTANTKMITITGGALDTLGAISAAAIINETTNGGYLVVGGVGGVALLRTSGGAGWTAADLRKSFENIGTAASFEVIGNYSNVRKIVADDQFLYVLTNTTFDRIPAAQLTGAITPTVMATPADLGLPAGASFSDVIVSSKLALLATSSGLYRVGNGKNIQTETAGSAVDWTKITLAEGPTAVTRLFALATTNLETDFAKQEGGGQVYALASSVAQKLSSVYRLATSDVSGSDISATSVVLIPDKLIQSTASPFAHIGEYRNFFKSDGALSVASRSKYITTAAVLKAFPTSTGVGSVLVDRQTQKITVADGQCALRTMVRNSALGSLIVPTNNGLQILE